MSTKLVEKFRWPLKSHSRFVVIFCPSRVGAKRVTSGHRFTETWSENESVNCILFFFPFNSFFFLSRTTGCVTAPSLRWNFRCKYARNRIKLKIFWFYKSYHVLPAKKLAECLNELWWICWFSGFSKVMLSASLNNLNIKVSLFLCRGLHHVFYSSVSSEPYDTKTNIYIVKWLQIVYTLVYVHQCW